MLSVLDRHTRNFDLFTDDTSISDSPVSVLTRPDSQGLNPMVTYMMLDDQVTFL